MKQNIGKQGATGDDLTQVVARIRRYEAAAARNQWHIGTELVEIADKALWKIRVDDAGRAAYRSFEQFVQHELGYNVTTAYMFLGVARAFDDAGVVARIGVVKASLLSKVNDFERRRLLPLVEGEGWNVRRLREAVRVWNDAHMTGLSHQQVGGRASAKVRWGKRSKLPDPGRMERALRRIAKMLKGHRDPTCASVARIAEEALST